MQYTTFTKKIGLGFFCLFIYFYATLCLAQFSKLENYTYLGEFSKDQANIVLQKVPPLTTLKANYALRIYKIQYKTSAPNGNDSHASGIVALPIAPDKKVGVVNYYHGTRVTRSDVPSRMGIAYYIYPALFSSHGGYMLVMPDYPGLGDSDLALHPYVHADNLAKSSIDMLIAAKELATKLNYATNDKLYLAGYSEGGFTTMVTYEALLKNHKDIPVTAVAAGSAPYDWNETMQFLTKDPGLRAGLYLAYFFYAMQTYEKYWQGLDGIFKKPYDTLIPTLFDGYHEAPEIIAALPSDPRKIVNDAFLDSIINGTNEHSDKLIKNLNHYDFKSTSPLLLVGTKGDKDLPYSAAEFAYARLKQQSDLVYIKSVSDVLDHIEALPFVLKEALDFFKQYDE